MSMAIISSGIWIALAIYTGLGKVADAIRARGDEKERT